jgi:hypothetical protein
MGDQEMLGASVAEFPQHLFADGGYPVEFGCRSDEFTHLPLLFCGQGGAPVRQRH